MTVFPGNYEDFRWRKEQAGGAQGLQSPSAAKAGRTVGRNGTTPSTSLGTGSVVPLRKVDGDEGRKATATAGDGHGTREGTCATSVGKKRLNPIKLRQMQDRQQELEEAVSRVEAEIAQCESGLQTFVSAQETARLTELLERRRSELEPLVAEWEALSVALESNV